MKIFLITWLTCGLLSVAITAMHVKPLGRNLTLLIVATGPISLIATTSASIIVGITYLFNNDVCLIHCENK